MRSCVASTGLPSCRPAGTDGTAGKLSLGTSLGALVCDRPHRLIVAIRWGRFVGDGPGSRFGSRFGESVRGVGSGESVRGVGSGSRFGESVRGVGSGSRSGESVRGVGSGSRFGESVRRDGPVGPVADQRSQGRFLVTLLEGLDVGDELVDLLVGENGSVGGHGGGVAFDHFGGRVEDAFAKVGFVGDEGAAVCQFDFAAEESVKAGGDGSCLGKVADVTSGGDEDLLASLSLGVEGGGFGGLSLRDEKGDDACSDDEGEGEVFFPTRKRMIAVHQVFDEGEGDDGNRRDRDVVRAPVGGREMGAEHQEDDGKSDVVVVGGADFGLLTELEVVGFSF